MNDVIRGKIIHIHTYIHTYIQCVCVCVCVCVLFSTCSRAEDILILSDKGEVFLYKTTTCCGYIFCYHTGRNVQVHICCCHDDLLTEEKLRKRRFLNKYHDVLHHTAHALSGMLSYLDFRLDRRKTIHYTLWTRIF